MDRVVFQPDDRGQPGEVAFARPRSGSGKLAMTSSRSLIRRQRVFWTRPVVQHALGGAAAAAICAGQPTPVVGFRALPLGASDGKPRTLGLKRLLLEDANRVMVSLRREAGVRRYGKLIGAAMAVVLVAAITWAVPAAAHTATNPEGHSCS